MVQDTSLQAYYEKVLPALGEKQREVLKVFDGINDYTNMEIARILGFSINRVTPRVFELRKLGLVKNSQRRQCKVTQNMAIAWTIADLPTEVARCEDGSVVLKGYVTREKWLQLNEQMMARSYKYIGDGTWVKKK